MTTLADLITESRFLANMENNQFCTDAELTTYINWEGAELYGILTTSFESWNVVGPITYTVTGSNNLIPVPADLWKVHGVDASSGGSWYPIDRFEWPQRGLGNQSLVATVTGKPACFYNLQGSNLYLVPELSSANTYRYWYIPKYVDLVNLTDTVDDAGDMQDWYEYIPFGTAIKMLNKAGDPMGTVPALMAQKEALRRRIELESKDRDDSAPRTAVNWRQDTSRRGPF